MPALPDADRWAIWAEWMKTDPVEITKPQLRAAVDAIDDWVSNNAAAINAAIPQPARGSLTAKQKAKMLMAVVARRFRVET